MPTTQAQDKPQAKNPIHHPATFSFGKEIPAKTVPVHSRTGRVLCLAKPNGNSGQNLVPEQESQGQATAGSGTGEVENGGQTDAATYGDEFPCCVLRVSRAGTHAHVAVWSTPSVLPLRSRPPAWDSLPALSRDVDNVTWRKCLLRMAL